MDVRLRSRIGTAAPARRVMRKLRRPPLGHVGWELALIRAWVVGVLAMGCGIATGQSLSIQSCAKISDDAQRLACFDRLAAETSAKSQAAQAQREPTRLVPAPTAAKEAVTPPSPEQKFGLPESQVRQLEAPSEVAPITKTSRIQARITKVSVYSPGRYVIELDNGQIWQQAESESNFYLKPGEPAVISTGALGSFWLATLDSHRAVRVKRLR